jgi:transcriptional regulator with XRE-family HTH domain
MEEKSIGQVIAEAREKKGLSQRQLAKLAKVNNSELSKIEAGIRKDPSPRILRKISNIIDVNYSELMYMIGLGLEVTPLNYFIKNHYSSMNLEELDTAEINVLGSIENNEKLVAYCEEHLNDKDLPEKQRTTLIHTIEDNKYQIYSSKEIIKLIQSLKVKERNKNAKK